MKHIFIFSLLITGFTFSSCQDWLDVKPKTSVNEEDLFSREIGFKEALTGIYVQMAGTDMYGRQLSYGLPDRLAQRYNDHRMSATFYNFSGETHKAAMKTIWERGYNIIANVNNMLEWIEKRPQVIATVGYHDIIKGEALGLRAFMYFDLLRMWGPIYKENPTSPAIPYRSQFNREDKNLAPANVVLDSIVSDLQRAEVLLVNDPMHIEFPSGANRGSGGDPFLQRRFKRMNLYAVKALLARVYLWKGDKANAARYAREVIAANDDRGRRFKLVTDNTYDLIYSTEILFSLSVNNFDVQVANDFNFNNATYYVDSRGRVEEMFNTSNDGVNDMRFREGQGFQLTVFNGCTRKYEQQGLYSDAIKKTVPLIRLSEMYYIVAECSNDLSESAYLISEVCAARGMDNVLPFGNEEERLERLNVEYRKEFYAESQYWYFLKRHFYKTFLFCPIDNMEEENYRFTLPDDEKVLGNMD